MMPIGTVCSGFKHPSELRFACRDGKNTKSISTIILNKELVDGLYRIEGFSHLWIMFVLHKADKIELKTYPGPKDLKGLPKAGVFATRSQYRPNHIALRLVKLLKVENNLITVNGLDAIDGSSVIDIKPFIPHFDLPEDIKEPDWYKWK